jgi:hypothetical protein
VSMVRLSPGDEEYAYWLGQAQQAARRLSIAARITVLVGCVVLLVSMFVTYLRLGPVSMSLWESTTRMPVILTVIAGIAIILTLLSFYRPGLALAVAVGSLFCAWRDLPAHLQQLSLSSGVLAWDRGRCVDVPRVRPDFGRPSAPRRSRIAASDALSAINGWALFRTAGLPLAIELR